MDVLKLLRQHEPELKKRFGIATIGIFGSFIRGEARPESDVDVLVTFREGEETFDKLYGLQVLSRRPVRAQCRSHHERCNQETA